VGLGRRAVGLAAEPVAAKVPLDILLLATVMLDVLAVALGWTGIEGGRIGNAWSHSLLMAVLWSIAA